MATRRRAAHGLSGAGGPHPIAHLLPPERPCEACREPPDGRWHEFALGFPSGPATPAILRASRSRILDDARRLRAIP